jgi:hypothetical protein
MLVINSMHDISSSFENTNILIPPGLYGKMYVFGLIRNEVANISPVDVASDKL